MMGHKICFNGKLSLNYPCYPFLSGALASEQELSYIPGQHHCLMTLNFKYKNFTNKRFKVCDLDNLAPSHGLLA